MYLRFKLLGRRIVFYNRKVEKVDGVNSLTKNGLHIPMIDTDECSMNECMHVTKKLQHFYKLGDASICTTGRPNSFHVYIWSEMDWRDAIKIVAAHELCDLKHLFFSLRREHFTLRISDKKGRKIEELVRIKSPYPTNCSYKDLQSFVSYETASKLTVE